MQTVRTQRYARRVQKMGNSAIRELLKVTEQPDVISFAGGLPAPDVFPVEAVASAAQRVLHASGSQALQYGATEGYTPLREMIVRRMTQEGLPIALENVLITSGSQQALDLLGKIFLDPGDTVVLESPTYVGALQAWTPYEAEYCALPIDEQGMNTEYLDEALQAHPKFIYALPTFQNPGGVTLSLERRQHLVEAASRWDVPIVEDDAYSQLRFEGDSLPSLLMLDSKRNASTDRCYRGNVIYISTFSKVISPGLRLGWIIAPPEVIAKLVQAKQGVDLHTSTFTQMIVHELANDEFFAQQVPLIRQTYRDRRDVMLSALTEHFPSDAHWTHPHGGMFLWITLPEAIDTGIILQEALTHKVAFVPGTSFHPHRGGKNTMRLNFSHTKPERIHEGIARLGQVLYAFIEQ